MVYAVENVVEFYCACGQLVLPRGSNGILDRLPIQTPAIPAAQRRHHRNMHRVPERILHLRHQLGRLMFRRDQRPGLRPGAQPLRRLQHVKERRLDRQINLRIHLNNLRRHPLPNHGYRRMAGPMGQEGRFHTKHHTFVCVCALCVGYLVCGEDG